MNSKTINSKTINSREFRDLALKKNVGNHRFHWSQILAMLPFAFLAACSSAPPAPDWQLGAQQSIERGTKAYLEGNARVESAEFARARDDIARTGRADLLARAALARCAAAVASLVQEPCTAFEKLREDAPSPERAYAEFLAAGTQASDAVQLPAQYRAVASAASDAAAAEAAKSIADPVSRLIAAGVVFKRGQANPALIELAIETASAQGWRRPLLAWLGVQAMRAEKAGATDEAERLRRRIRLVETGG
jgi:hypothetical protein